MGYIMRNSPLPSPLPLGEGAGFTSLWEGLGEGK